MAGMLNKLTLFGILAFGTAFGAAGTTAQTIQEPFSKLAFPTEVTFNANGKDYRLVITGVNVRSALIYKVFAVAQYLEDYDKSNPASIYDQLLSNKKAKQITARYLMSVSDADVRKGTIDNFKRVLNSQQQAKFKPIIDQILSKATGPIKSGDEFVYRWIPPATYEIYKNGQLLLSVENEEYLKVVWTDWQTLQGTEPKGALLKSLGKY